MPSLDLIQHRSGLRQPLSCAGQDDIHGAQEYVVGALFITE
jgi:hypothetical protein